MTKIKILIVFILFSNLKVISQEKSSFNIDDWRILLSDSIVDIDGNKYSQQKLGEHILLVQNLKTTRFNNGDSILKLNDSLSWISTNFPAFCDVIGRTHTSSGYNDILTKEIFYNSFVVNDSRNVCPQGWHIPKIAEWEKIEAWVDSCNQEFVHFFSHRKPWYSDVTFSGLSFSDQPFGYRSGQTAKFINYLDFGFWWSKEAVLSIEAWESILFDRGFGVDDVHVDYSSNIPDRFGMSIKCIKDIAE
jgi:uncharacterized protein (TIGR02145 family)